MEKTDSQIIDALGGNHKVAKLCDTLPDVVSGWRRRGIPKGWRAYLKKIRPQAFKETEQ